MNALVHNIFLIYLLLPFVVIVHSGMFVSVCWYVIRLCTRFYKLTSKCVPHADNINPIEKMERSSLIVASTIHHVAPVELLADNRHAATSLV